MVRRFQKYDFQALLTFGNSVSSGNILMVSEKNDLNLEHDKIISVTSMYFKEEVKSLLMITENI